MASKFEIVIDSREQDPLQFPSREITTVREALDVGDYAIRIDGRIHGVRVERKSIGDLFNSFSGESYTREKNKIERSKEYGLKYIIAIEGTCSEVRKGHRYYKEGAWHQVKKDGLTQVRQLMTISQKYNIEVWYCAGREDMSFRIQEYLMTHTRGVL